MVQVNIVVREIGKLKPDFSLDFELPEVPAVGSYISILRPDTPEPYGEDLVVRKVWWRIKHPEIKGLDDLAPAKIGSFHEIFVECNQAAGPYSSDNWLSLLDSAKKRGVEIEEFPEATDPSFLAQRAVRRQTPKVGAECPNWARSDLSGGRSEMGVPTGNGQLPQAPVALRL